MNKIEKGPAFWKAFGQAAALWAAVAVAGSLLLPGGSMTLPEEPEKMGWTVLRVCAVLPLGEELIFRGGVQRLLRPLGPGVALAGHLRLLEAVSRTRFRPETQGKVVFIESPDLAPPEAERTLKALRESGFFDSCAAVVFGRLSGCGEREEAVMRDFAEEMKSPVYMGFPYSHTSRNQMIDLFGKVMIDAAGRLRR